MYNSCLSSLKLSKDWLKEWVMKLYLWGLERMVKLFESTPAFEELQIMMTFMCTITVILFFLLLPSYYCYCFVCFCFLFIKDMILSLYWQHGRHSWAQRILFLFQPEKTNTTHTQNGAKPQILLLWQILTLSL